MNLEAKYFRELDSILREAFGEPQKSYEDPTDALIRGILSQNTNDRNRDRAFDALKSVFPEWEDVIDADDTIIAELIHPAGMANQRSSRIKNLLRWIIENNAGNLDASFLLSIPADSAMKKLIEVKGIGMKTAAVFLLFCGGKPFFPVDTHIKRIMIRLGVFPQKTSAGKMIPILSGSVPDELHYVLHMNCLTLGRKICTARKTNCKICPVQKLCTTGIINSP